MFDTMQKTLIATAAALMLLAPLAGALGSIQDAAPIQRQLVGFHESPGLAPGDTYMGEPIVHVDEDLAFIVVETRDVDLLAAKARLDGNVRYVESDEVGHQLQLTPNDPQYTQAGMYGVKITKINLAWDTTLGSTSVKVAVIDSGINRNHEDFVGGRVLQGWDFYNNDNDPDDHTYCYFHGSHTAGTAAASTNNGKGIAGVSQSTILPIKIFQGKSPSPFGGCAATTTTGFVNAIKYAGDQGAHVSSNSWGGGSMSTAINDAIVYSHNKGVTHVGAAGNSGSCTNCVGEPWKSVGDAYAIVVSASTATDGFASFSSQGPQVDVIAPGDDILSVNGGSTTGYKLMDGTSMATPHVSGVAALIKTLYPAATVADVDARIQASADNLGMISDRQGAGRLDGVGAIL